jgi:hypothetical protein
MKPMSAVGETARIATIRELPDRGYGPTSTSHGGLQIGASRPRFQPGGFGRFAHAEIAVDQASALMALGCDARGLKRICERSPPPSTFRFLSLVETDHAKLVEKS